MNSGVSDYFIFGRASAAATSTFISVASKDGIARSNYAFTAGEYADIGNIERFGVQRAFLYFDTSAVSGQITGAKLKIYGYDFTGGRCSNVGMLDIKPCSFSPLSVSDFSSCINNPTIATASLSSRYAAVSIPAAYITQGSATQFLLKSKDESCTTGRRANFARICMDGGTRWGCRNNEKPVLEVTYAAATPDGPSCSDSIQNNGETGVDCGDPCPACAGNDFNVIVMGWDGVQRDHFFECYNKELPECQNGLPNIKELSNDKIFNITVTDGATDTKSGWVQILTGYNASVTGVYSNYDYHPISAGYTK
jgi:hypothetical protein